MYSSFSSIIQNEKRFYDDFWKQFCARKIYGTITIPGISTLKDKKVLICSCGSGIEVVQAANGGGDVYSFDISLIGAQKARENAVFNDVTSHIQVMDFHKLGYKDNVFDVIYGASILHHIDCARVGKEIYRCLKPDGIAYFKENSDRNPILRIMRRILFGKPGGFQRKSFLFFSRNGTSDEYPLTENEVATLTPIFKGNIRRTNDAFYFFQLLDDILFKNRVLRKILMKLDAFMERIPGIKKYSFAQELILKKK